MYYLRTTTALCLLFAITSCDKARDLAEKATAKVKENISAKTNTSSADPELRKLVDETPDGVVFRKDLPFPTNLEVRITRSQEWSGRLFQQTEFEPRTQTIKGTRNYTHLLQRTGDQLRLTAEQSAFTIPNPEDSKNPVKTLADPLKPTASDTKTITLNKQGSTWQADPSAGFRGVVLARELSPLMQDVLVENALAPRPLWFSPKKRFKPGDTLTVAGESLPMLVAGKASGTLKLTFESQDAIDGHPCAVFAIQGDYTRQQFPDLDGQLSDEEVTIQAGKIWLSLIHPIILREDLDTIQSIKYGTPATHAQGSVKVSITRSWKTTGN